MWGQLAAFAGVAIALGALMWLVVDALVRTHRARLRARRTRAEVDELIARWRAEVRDGRYAQHIHVRSDAAERLN